MKRLLVIFFCCLSVFSACSSSKPKPTAESKATYAGMKLGRPGPVKGAIDPTAVFLTSDESIVALVELDDLRETVEVRWDWIAPGEKFYVSASRKVGPTGEGRLYPKVALSHALNVDREEASGRPGLWAVELYVDGTLKDTQRFNIEPGLTTLRAPLVPPDPRKWALVIGIERYSHLPPVEFASSDAKAVANYFTNLLGVPEKNVILLENEKATRAAVTGRLKDYLPGNVEKWATVFVYFAGHGMPDVATGEPYLMLYDSESTNVARTGYKVKEALADLGALNVTNVFVFTDACFSGMAARGDKMLVTGARPAVIRVEDVNLATGKVVAMGASTGGQLSHSYRDKRHGLFTYFVLSGLTGQADVNKDGSVTFGELYPFVKENVERVSRRTTMEQVPTIAPRVETVSNVALSVVPKPTK